MLGKSRNQGRDEYRGIQKNSHERRAGFGLERGQTSRARANWLLFGSGVPLGPLLPLFPKLLDDVEVLVRELAGMNQKIPLALKRGLLASRAKGDRFSTFFFSTDIQFKRRAGFKPQPVSNGLRNHDATVVVDSYLHGFSL
jgi:hypothetical protein